MPATAGPTVQIEPLALVFRATGGRWRGQRLPLCYLFFFFFQFVSLFGWLVRFQSVRRHASDDVRNVKDELHVHGGLGDAGAASVDDGDQGAVQLVHVALGEELASAAGLVLHLQV